MTEKSSGPGFSASTKLFTHYTITIRLLLRWLLFHAEHTTPPLRPVLLRLRTMFQQVRFSLKKRDGIVLVIDSARFQHRLISITGWVLADTQAGEVSAVEITLDSRPVGRALLGGPRADVYDSYPFIPKSGRSGFHFYAPIASNLTTHASLTLTVSTHKGHHYRKTITCTPDTLRYEQWIKDNEPSPEKLAQQRHTTFSYRPLISLMTILESPLDNFLVSLIQSVIHQSYPQWEWHLLVSPDNQTAIEAIFQQHATACSERIIMHGTPKDTGIAERYNIALNAAKGDLVGVLEAGDTLALHALFEMTKALQTETAIDCIYSDEDRLRTDTAQRYQPHFKPDWSPDTLRSTNYIGHLALFQRALLKRIGGFRTDIAGNYYYDLVLRATEKSEKIFHISKVLYHRRMTPPHDAPHDQSWHHQVLQDHLKRSGLQGTVEPAQIPEYYKVTYRLHTHPNISIIIPNRDHAQDLERCITSIVQKSSYQNIEILILENHSTQAETFKLYDRLKAEGAEIRILQWHAPFNYSAINNFAASHAKGTILLFLNNDTEVINADWLERMLEHALRDDIGAVGAKLYYPDNTIQHAGLIIGMGGIAGHGHRYFPRTHPGYQGNLAIIRNISAVTAACLMIRRDVFETVGGFDEEYAVAFNDIDLCLKVYEKGYLNIWTPYAELYHYESTTRSYGNSRGKVPSFGQEESHFRQKWQQLLIKGDPYYNSDFDLSIH